MIIFFNKTCNKMSRKRKSDYKSKKRKKEKKREFSCGPDFRLDRVFGPRKKNSLRQEKDEREGEKFLLFSFFTSLFERTKNEVCSIYIFTPMVYVRHYKDYFLYMKPLLETP